MQVFNRAGHGPSAILQSTLHRGQTSEAVFVFFISREIIHVNVEASVRICKTAAEGKYILSYLKRRFFTLKNVPHQNKIALTMAPRVGISPFSNAWNFFSKVPKNLVTQENTC